MLRSSRPGWLGSSLTGCSFKTTWSRGSVQSLIKPLTWLQKMQGKQLALPCIVPAGSLPHQRLTTFLAAHMMMPTTTMSNRADSSLDHLAPQSFWQSKKAHPAFVTGTWYVIFKAPLESGGQKPCLARGVVRNYSRGCRIEAFKEQQRRREEVQAALQAEKEHNADM